MYKIKPPFNINRVALAAGVEAIKDNEWTKRAIQHNTLWAKKIFTILKEKMKFHFRDISTLSVSTYVLVDCETIAGICSCVYRRFMSVIQTLA